MRDPFLYHGRCFGCGYLSKRVVATAELFEFPLHERGKGVPSPPHGRHTVAFCFVNAHDLPFEVVEEIIKSSAMDAGAAGQQVFFKDRRCSMWFPYQEGLPPQEHYKAHHQQTIDIMKQELEDQREQDRKQFELALHQISESQEAQTRKVTFRLMLAAVVLAVAQVIAAILALSGQSWIVKLFD